jgi:hypothetical protein
MLVIIVSMCSMESSGGWVFSRVSGRKGRGDNNSDGGLSNMEIGIFEQP